MKRIMLLASLLCLSQSILAQEAGNWFIRPTVGYSIMSDPDANSRGIGTIDGDADIELDDGFSAGLGIGYFLTSHWALELNWEYRSNDSEVTLANGDRFNDGNYASSLFFLNGIYFFDARDKWQPYLGAGLSWAEEVDIDLERGGREQSYSTDGDVGYQVFAGVNYRLARSWAVQGEVRYGAITGLDLDGEGEPGEIRDIDYETTTLQLAVMYEF